MRMKTMPAPTGVKYAERLAERRSKLKSITVVTWVSNPNPRAFSNTARFPSHTSTSYGHILPLQSLGGVEGIRALKNAPNIRACKNVLRSTSTEASVAVSSPAIRCLKTALGTDVLTSPSVPATRL